MFINGAYATMHRHFFISLFMPVSMASTPPATPYQEHSIMQWANTCSKTGMILEHGIEDSNNKKKLTNDHRLAVARAVQNAVVAQLEEKIILALKWCAEHRDEIIREVQEQNSLSDLGLPVKHIVVSGGVASNLFFRKRYHGFS